MTDISPDSCKHAVNYAQSQERTDTSSHYLLILFHFTKNSIALQQKFKRGLMSANTLPPFLLCLLLLFDCQFLCCLQVQVQERDSTPRKFKRKARYLNFSYPTKQAKRKRRYVHATTRVFLLDKPHVHFIAHHRHNDPQLLRTHLHATNLSRSISLQRLAIRTIGAVN